MRAGASSKEREQALAQGHFNGVALVVGGVGEAHQQQVAAAAGRDMEVAVKPVGLVIKIVAAGFARLKHAPVEIEHAVGKDVRKAGAGGDVGPLGQACGALGGGVEVFHSKVDQPGAVRAVDRMH